MDKKIKVLHIVGSMYPGGMENFIMNIYEHIDRDKYQFDFAEHAVKENGYEKRIEELGGKTFLLPRMTTHPIKSLRELAKIVDSEKYDIVIRHTPNALIAPQLLVAKLKGATTVCHSHNTTDPQLLAHKLGKLLLRRVTDIRLACSVDAGKWMFDKQNFVVANNAIDLDRFKYSEKKADEIKNEFGLNDKHVYGHIANFIASKNHPFLLEVFKEISRIDDKAVLVCLGEGDIRDEIETKIKSLGLEGKVILTGMRPDSDKFMSAFDVMIFPSLFEGLPLTLIEAQVSGLPIVMSDRITDNVIVTNNLVFKKSLDSSAKEWAEYIVTLHSNLQIKNRECQIESIREHGYDLNQLVTWYEDFLKGIMEKKND